MEISSRPSILDGNIFQTFDFRWKYLPDIRFSMEISSRSSISRLERIFIQTSDFRWKYLQTFDFRWKFLPDVRFSMEISSRPSNFDGNIFQTFDSMEISSWKFLPDQTFDFRWKLSSRHSIFDGNRPLPMEISSRPSIFDFLPDIRMEIPRPLILFQTFEFSIRKFLPENIVQTSILDFRWKYLPDRRFSMEISSRPSDFRWKYLQDLRFSMEISSRPSIFDGNFFQTFDFRWK